MSNFVYMLGGRYRRNSTSGTGSVSAGDAIRGAGWVTRALQSRKPQQTNDCVYLNFYAVI